MSNPYANDKNPITVCAVSRMLQALALREGEAGVQAAYRDFLATTTVDMPQSDPCRESEYTGSLSSAITGTIEIVGVDAVGTLDSLDLDESETYLGDLRTISATLEKVSVGSITTLALLKHPLIKMLKIHPIIARIFNLIQALAILGIFMYKYMQPVIGRAIERELTQILKCEKIKRIC